MMPGRRPGVGYLPHRAFLSLRSTIITIERRVKMNVYDDNLVETIWKIIKDSILGPIIFK